MKRYSRALLFYSTLNGTDLDTRDLDRFRNPLRLVISIGEPKLMQESRDQPPGKLKGALFNLKSEKQSIRL